MSDTITVDASQVSSINGIDPSKLTVIKSEPGAFSRFSTGTGIPGLVSALMKAPEGDDNHATAFAKNVYGIVKDMAGASAEHLKSAAKYAENGDYTSAVGHMLYSTPGVGPLGYQIANDIHGGNYAGAAGGLVTLFGPKLAKAATPVIAGAADAAGNIAKDAVVGGYRGGMAPTPSIGGVSVPASVAGLVGGGAADLGLSHLGVPPEIAPAIGFSAPIIKGAVAGVRQGVAARASSAATAAAKTATEGRVPLWQQAQEAAAQAPQQVSLSSLAEMSPERIQAAARQRFADNLAARQTSNQQSPAAMVDRLKALGATSDADQAAQPQAPAPQVPLSNLATPHDLSSQLKVYLDQLRAADPDYEGPAEPAEPDMVDVLQRSIDAAKAKRASK